MGERARFQLSVDGKDAEVRSLAELRRRLAEGTASEIWLTRRDGQALSLLVSGDRGWPMFLREPGSVRASSWSAGWPRRSWRAAAVIRTCSPRTSS